jgi:hypothetical protein
VNKKPQDKKMNEIQCLINMKHHEQSVDILIKNQNNQQYQHNLIVYLAKNYPSILCSFDEISKNPQPKDPDLVTLTTKEPEYIRKIKEIMSEPSIFNGNLKINAIKYLRDYVAIYPEQFKNVLKSQLDYQDKLSLKNAKDIVERISEGGTWTD